MAPPKKMVVIYDKDGNKHTVDHLNAVDKVASLGYTYQPGRSFTPVETPPHALKTQELLKRDPQGARRAQSILDGVGSYVRSGADEDEIEDETVFDALEAEGTSETVDEVVQEPAAEAAEGNDAAAEEPKVRRSRGRKAAD